MTIELLQATSSDTALQRVRLEEDFGYPAYDPDPQSNLRHVAPRDVFGRCDACGRLYVQQHWGGNAQRFCSQRCQSAASQRAYVARRVAS